MQKLKNWIEAFRLRTLFLALASVLTGSLLALGHNDFSIYIFILTLVTTIALQVLSNLANDYGDSQKGTDNANRIGPKRTLQTGKISAKEMRRLILAFVFISLMSGIALILISFTAKQPFELALFLLFGIAAIAAALKYTIGNKSYGYSGFGDFFVLLFFGFLGVLGSYYLQTQAVDAKLLFPSISIGLFSVGVLNLNNMRDIENDAAFGKRTIPVRIGLSKAKLYHYTLISIGWLSILLYAILSGFMWQNCILLVSLPVFVLHIYRVYEREGVELDPLLKQLSIATFLFSILTIISFVVEF